MDQKFSPLVILSPASHAELDSASTLKAITTSKLFGSTIRPGMTIKERP
ncbi:MAG: hypothetical protein LCH20_01560 [Proteobacteria bacterium]|nr:hypothetical protein [Pseudomonadota bacterium]